MSRLPLLLLAAGPLLAHEGEPIAPHDLWSAWAFEPLPAVCLTVAALLYWRGSRPLWQGGATGRGVRPAQAVCFWAGWAALVIALISPLHPLGGALFSAHMAQHEVLMTIAAPLLVLGRPLVPWLWALPLSWRRAAGRMSRRTAVERTWRALTEPFTATLVHGAALWVWHVPALFQMTLTSELAHTAQHLSFLVSALLFWWALLYGRQGRPGYGAAFLCVFFTALHSGILGALLTFAPLAWYPAYGNSPLAWGLSPLEDQQLAGLIMWVPAGVVYLIAGLALFAGWMKASEARYAE